jgi:hypothetical protein
MQMSHYHDPFAEQSRGYDGADGKGTSGCIPQGLVGGEGVILVEIGDSVTAYDGVPCGRHGRAQDRRDQIALSVMRESQHCRHPDP